MMNAVKKFVFAVSITLALALTGVATTQAVGQDRKPPERPRERDKQEPKDRGDNKDRRDDNKKNDDRRGGDRKKP
jgi:hypothetical protein